MAFRNDQVSEIETAKILELLREVLSRRVLGDVVELGCYKGDTSLCLAEVLRDFEKNVKKASKEDAVIPGALSRNAVRVNKNDESDDRFLKSRRLWIYDSFEGLPEKTTEDLSELGRDFKKGALSTSKADLKKRFLRAGLPLPVIKKAWFSDLSTADLPSAICLAFLDGDFYQSIRDSLNLVGSLLSSGAVMVIHDYANPTLPGVAKAADEWLAIHPEVKTQIYQSMLLVFV